MKMNRKVVFWGCGDIAKDAYCKYKDEFELLYVISNNLKEHVFCPEEGQIFEVKRPKNKVDDEEGMIIICSADYQKIAEQLSLLGYIPFVDFMDYELAEMLWAGKKIVLLYGFCHLRGIADCLKTAKSFSKAYIPVYYPDYLFLNYYQHMRLLCLLDHCSVLIYGMALSPENHRKNAAILGSLGGHVKVLCLYAAYFGGYFPQIKRAYNNMNEFAVKSEGYDYTPFSYGDSWMNACIEMGMDLDDIFEKIEKKEIYNRDFVLKYLDGEWKRLKYQEKESDFRIVEYIEKTYKKQRLFRNETHMENSILYQYALQILHYLGYDDKIDIIDVPLLNCSQHFIYPCVAEFLGLEWDVWEEELDLYTYAGWMKVNMREYIKKYYESCSEMRKLKKNYFLP